MVSVSSIAFLTSVKKRITSDFFSQEQLDNHQLTFAGQTIGKQSKEKMKGLLIVSRQLIKRKMFAVKLVNYTYFRE